MLSLSRPQEKMKAEPVTVRVIWNAEKNEPVLEKFNTGQEGTGWRSFDAENLRLIDPARVPKEIEDVVLRALMVEDAKAKFQKASVTIARAWSQTLQNTTRYLEIDRDQFKEVDAEEVQAISPKQFRHSQIVSVPHGTPMVGAKGDIDLKDWTVEDGQWIKDTVRLRMVVGKSTLGGTPDFRVEARGLDGNEEFTPIHQTSNIKDAFFKAQATHALLEQRAEPFSCWHGTENWAQADTLSKYSYPKHLDVLGAVFMENENDRGSLRSRAQSQVFVLQKTHHNDVNRTNQWEWVKLEGSAYNKPQVYWHREDHNPALDLIRKAEETTNAFVRDLTDKSDWTVTLKNHTAEVIRDAWNQMDDGEEPLQAPQILAQWARLEARLLQKAAQDENYVQFGQQMNGFVEEALHSLQTKPKARGPKA